MLCPKCRNDNSADSAFCRYCGAVLSAPPAPSPNVRLESPTAPPISLHAAPPGHGIAANSPATAAGSSPIRGSEIKPSAGDAALAGTGDRAIAALVDIVVAAALFPLVGMWAALRWGGVTANGFELHGAAAFVTLFIVCTIWFLYIWLLEGLFGATLGKWLMNIRVRRVDGSAVGLGKSFIRNLLRLIDGIGVYLVGFLVAIMSRRRQRLGDHVAGTLVVQGTAGKPVRIAAATACAAIIAGCFIGAFRLHSGAPVSAPSAGTSQSTSPIARPATQVVPVSNVSQVTRAELGTDRTDDYRIVGPATNFYTNTPKIVCVWDIQSNDSSVPIRSVWIAEDVGAVAPPNYQIAEKSLAGFKEGSFSLDAPTNGFPVGRYRLDIYIGEKLAKQIPFTITQR